MGPDLAAWTADGASFAQLSQHVGGVFTDSNDVSHLGELEPAAAAAAAVGVNAAEEWCDALAAAGRSISTADLLQRLHSDPSLGFDCGATCLRQLHKSAAAAKQLFGRESSDAILASLLLTNYIAEVGDRAQLFLGAEGQYGEARMRACSECLALTQEVEGLLQLSGQPALLQLLGGQKLQVLVEGLTRCKPLLGDKLRSLNVLCL
jgi:hypothetical protein